MEVWIDPFDREAPVFGAELKKPQGRMNMLPVRAAAFLVSW